MTPLKRWQAGFDEHGAEWLRANPRPSNLPEDREARRAWGVAREQIRAAYIRANPPPDRTEAEDRQKIAEESEAGWDRMPETEDKPKLDGIPQVFADHDAGPGDREGAELLQEWHMEIHRRMAALIAEIDAAAVWKPLTPDMRKKRSKLLRLKNRHFKAAGPKPDKPDPRAAPAPRPRTLARHRQCDPAVGASDPRIPEAIPVRSAPTPARLHSHPGAPRPAHGERSMKRQGKTLKTLRDGHPRRMSDARNAWRKMTDEQREQFLAWTREQAKGGAA